MTLTVEVLFAAVFGQALVAYLRDRSVVRRDVVLVFSAMALVFALEVWRRVLGPPPMWLGGLSSALLLAQPYLTLQLVSRLRPVRRTVRVGALVATVVTAAPFLLGRPMPAPVILAAVAVFVGVQVTAAGFLYGAARRRSGAPRIRLMAAAVATAAFAVAILAAGAGAAAGGAGAAAGTTALVVALASGVGYLVAFVPPRWLRRSWSTSAAYQVTTRLLHTPAGEAPAQTWQHYVDAVCDVTGADAAMVLLVEAPDRMSEAASARVRAEPHTAHSPQAVDELLAAGQPVCVGPSVTAPALATALAARINASYVTAVPLRLRSTQSGVLVVLNTHQRLFSDDDIALLGDLGAQAGVLAERATLLGEQERLAAELAQSVDALSLAGKAKSDFLANMSHELRTPLSAIIGFSDLMDTDTPDANGENPVPVQWVRHIRGSGRHLLDLINDILDLAKVEAGRIDLKPEPLALPAATTDVVTTLRAVSDRKALHVTTDVPAITVTADRIRLRQVLDNLLSNAIKFTPDGGHIHLAAQQTDTEVRISVTDTGVGIAMEDQKKVFEEFAQVGDHSARQAGTGLGLTLTRRLVEAHGGTIELHSEPGAGSRFTVCLPRHIGTTTAADNPAPTAPLPGAILVIEDDPAAAQLLTTYLAEVGYPAAVATSGEDGLRYATTHHPQAILLDIVLPDTDGWEILRQLKDDAATKYIPVIVTTVLEHHDVGMALGAVDYLTKPVDPTALVSILNRHALLPAPPATATVLAIDDDPGTLALIRATLAQHGADTRTAHTGADGIAMARREHHDLIICDLLLPDIDGFAVTTALSNDPATRHTPVLVLTSSDLTEADKTRLSSHVIDIVGKGETARESLRQWLTRISDHPPRAALPLPASRDREPHTAS